LSTNYCALYIYSDYKFGHDEVKVFNCTFENLRSANNYSSAICVLDIDADFNVSNSLFRNTSGKEEGDKSMAGCIYLVMNTGIGGTYELFGNTFFNIFSNKSAVNLDGAFSSFVFANNSFSNIYSSSEGGVYLRIYLFIYLCFKAIFISDSIDIVCTIEFCCFINCSATKGFYFLFKIILFFFQIFV
jgi:hypothetical protein